MITAEELHKLYWTDNLSMREIGERYGASPETVRLWMTRHNIPSRPKREAAILSYTEWTPERIKMLRALWPTSLTCVEIKNKLGLQYGPRSVSAKAAALGLPSRQERAHRVESKPRLGLMAGAATIAARGYEDRTLITFPENPKLQADWESTLAAVRAERGMKLLSEARA